MRTASTDFIAAATTDYARYYGKFTVGETEYTVPLTDLKVTASENGSSDLTIGNAQSSSITFSMYEDTVDLENREMVLFEGLEVSEGNIEYIQIGIFKITSATAEEGKTSYTGYDRMYSAMEMTYVSKLTYPNGDINIVKEICTQAGITFVESTMDDRTISIATAPKGYTRREMLGFLAARQGKNAVINSQGQLEFRWYKDADYTIRPTKYYENGLKFTTSKAFKVEKIVCEVATDKDSKTLTSGSGTMAINISNPFMTQAVLDAVYKKIGGFTYRPLTVECLGDWRLEVGDIVKVTSDGVEYSAPITSIVYDCDGGLKCSIESCGQSDTNNSINPTGPITSQMQRLTAELITANQVIATKISAEQADIKYATIESLNVLSGKFDTLSAKAITTDNLAAATAKLGYMTAEQADIKYANIELTNIATANVAKLFANVGLIDRATVVEGHITGFLDSVEVNANKITAGTLVADRILLKGSESGLLYALNNLGKLTSTTVDSLDGYVLTDRTINADKIVANSITANELDVANIFADNAVISTITSQSAFINAISTNKVVVGAANAANNASKTAGEAKTTADTAKQTANGIKENIYSPNTTTIDGGKITTNSIKAKQIDVTNVFAQDIQATGTITGATLKGTTAEIDNGSIGGFNISNQTLTATFDCWGDYTISDYTKVKNYAWYDGTLNTQEKVYYDVNNDGKIDILDMADIKGYLWYNMQLDNKPINSKCTVTLNPSSTDTITLITERMEGNVDDVKTVISPAKITTPQGNIENIQCTSLIIKGQDDSEAHNLPGNANVQIGGLSTFSNTATFEKNPVISNSDAPFLSVQKGTSKIDYGVSPADNKGIYLEDNDRWLIREDTNKNTYISGDTVSITIKPTDPTGTTHSYSFRPYVTIFNTILLNHSLGGYITGGGYSLSFFIPVNVPMVGDIDPYISFGTGQGVTVRQGGKYCYGSSASTPVTPARQSVTVVPGSGVNVVLSMQDNINVTNNDACGIAISGTLNFGMKS